MIVIKVFEGDIVKKIGEEMEKRGIRKACITAGLGYVKNVKLGYFTGNGYKTSIFKGPFELLSAIGYYEDGRVHLHVVLGDEKYQTLGGHLISAEVAHLFQFSFEEVSE